MNVMIPTRDCANYLDDHDKVYQWGGRWNFDLSCYQFIQSDIEAYIEATAGNWTLLNDKGTKNEYETT